ncbi:MAG TPA: M20 family metallo-hydrolase [Flavisolibacter sp.]|jgi:acetylornithine deacetylase|nr:M20 family metallo-hydrolase [Flavisolibacter sp.]
MTDVTTILKDEAIQLLQQLIALPSFSKEEWQTASLLTKHFFDKGLIVTRVGNNVLLKNLHFDERKPTLLLNSHHDTVKPNPNYTRDPFQAAIEGERLYGLGSNDAGGSLVALAAAFLYFNEVSGLKYNLVFAATAEEEISGADGIEMALQHLPRIDCAIVGEPTQMQLAVAEKGLMVLDCIAHGRAGHAAREEGDNAIYKAMMDIEWIYVHRFEKVSPFLGPVKTSVTSIETENKAHNVVPSQCRFTIDVRLNECYSMEEVLKEIRSHFQSDVTPRSMRLRSSSIPMDHSLVKAGLALGRTAYGSPTTSDKALMPFPALKMGPGDSARSHTADEFIWVEEIRQGIDMYIDVLKQVLL